MDGQAAHIEGFDTHFDQATDAAVAEENLSLVPALDSENLHKLAASAARLGYEVVDISGFLDEMAERSEAQITGLQGAFSTAEQVITATETVTGAAVDVKTAAETALELADHSVGAVRESATRSTDVASWVTSVSSQIDSLVTSLAEVEKNNALISDIASQVNFLSINARIEASRAGDAGRGFAVIAQAVNELSTKTNEVAEQIKLSIDQLNEDITGLSRNSEEVRSKADQVIEDGKRTDAALGEIAGQIRGVHEKSVHIDDEAGKARNATATLSPALDKIRASIKDTSGRIAGVTDRTHDLIDRSEEIVQGTVSLGGATEDSVFIERVQQDAAILSDALENAVQTGRITTADLFCRDYAPIPGTRPAQVMAPFTTLTDELFTPVQEAALDFCDQVVFCAAVNLDGYLPTHNLKFSKPQGDDEGWNTANCRNRRIFDDRVGLKSGRNTAAFLLQVYRRDMGNGVFKLMKDVSAPIMVCGRHWGGLRLAYDA
jgi:methyl-accepting chemotaxis protein